MSAPENQRPRQLSRIVRAIRSETDAWTAAVVRHCPGYTGRFLRRRYVAHSVSAIGAGARIHEGVEIVDGRRIAIGDRFTADRGAFVAAANGGRIVIGDDVVIGANAVVDASDDGLIELGSGTGVAFNSILRSSGHRYDDSEKPWREQGHVPNSIVVEDDVWIAAHVVVLPGAHIERGCVVASGSVVGGRVGAFSIVAGNPARPVGRRGSSRDSRS